MQDPLLVPTGPIIDEEREGQEERELHPISWAQFIETPAYLCALAARREAAPKEDEEEEKWYTPIRTRSKFLPNTQKKKREAKKRDDGKYQKGSLHSLIFGISK